MNQTPAITVELHSIFEHQDFEAAAAAIKTLLTKPSTADYIHIVAALAAAQSMAQRHIYFLEHQNYGVKPTGMSHSLDACHEVVQAIRRAWAQHADIGKSSAERPMKFDLRKDSESTLALA